jgi:hypothetical protein
MKSIQKQQLTNINDKQHFQNGGSIIKLPELKSQFPEINTELTLPISSSLHPPPNTPFSP